MRIIQCSDKDEAWRRGHEALENGWKFQKSYTLHNEYIFQVSKGLSNVKRFVAKLYKERMPRVYPHPPSVKKDKQLINQKRWLKEHNFTSAREAQEAGY